jgi:hypothetical protein
MQRKALVGTTLLIALLALMVTVNGDTQAIAGTAAPNVAGKWGGPGLIGSAAARSPSSCPNRAPTSPAAKV